MEERYIAYFDLMGFKSFIYNNSGEHVVQRMRHVFRDIESALGLGERTDDGGGAYISDISESGINCINISDTIIFWTKDNTFESFAELLSVAYRLNWTLICYNFPVRGTLSYGEIQYDFTAQQSEKGGLYNVNCLYGKGLVDAHMKAENLNFAGCVIDNSVMERVVNDTKIDVGIEKYMDDIAVKYMVPYKKASAEEHLEEYVMRLVKNEPINNEFFGNKMAAIERVFFQDNKDVTDRAKTMFSNTQKFLTYLK